MHAINHVPRHVPNKIAPIMQHVVMVQRLHLVPGPMVVHVMPRTAPVQQQLHVMRDIIRIIQHVRHAPRGIPVPPGPPHNRNVIQPVVPVRVLCRRAIHAPHRRAVGLPVNTVYTMAIFPRLTIVWNHMQIPVPRPPTMTKQKTVRRQSRRVIVLLHQKCRLNIFAYPARGQPPIPEHTLLK